MNYFDLRKRADEPEPDEVGEDETPAAVEAEETEGEKPAAKANGPLLTGLLGPGRWLAARFGVSTAWGVYAAAAWMIFYYRGVIGAGIIAVWLLAVLLFTPREYLDRLAASIERLDNRPHKDAEDEEEPPPTDPLVVLLWHLIGDAPGAHLKTVAKRMQEASGQPVDRASVRARVAAIRGRLDALQIPVKASVRDAAGKVNEGVHRADLKAWEEALSPEGTGTPSGTPSGRVEGPVACDVGKSATAVASRPRLRRLLSRGGA
jgi:hypothetical protein